MGCTSLDLPEACISVSRILDLTGRVMITRSAYRRVYLDDGSQLHVPEPGADGTFEASMIVERVVRQTKRPDEYGVHIYGRAEIPHKGGWRRGKAYFSGPELRPLTPDPQPLNELPPDVTAYCIGKEAMLDTLLAEGDLPEEG